MRVTPGGAASGSGWPWNVQSVVVKTTIRLYTGAIRSTQRATDQAFDRLSETVEGVRSKAAPMLNKVASQAEAAARRGMDAVRDTSQQLRDRAMQAQDMTVAYVKDEPIKAMLIAAATGALLMGLITLLSRSRD